MKLSVILALALAASTITVLGDAAANWEKSCAKCHGADGKGDTKLGKKAEVKDMTTADFQAGLKDDKALKSLKEGIKEGDKVRKKPIEGYSDAELLALVAHIRTLKK